MREAADHHLRHGTTTLLGSLVSAPAEHLVERIRALLPLVASGDLAGIHLEGPFLSAARCGAQDPRSIVPGDPALLRRLIDAGEGDDPLGDPGARDPAADRAAGRPGGRRRHPQLRAHRRVGGRDARGDHGPSADDRLGATHLFNGMPPLHSRAPGPVAACLAAAARGAMVVELVGDGVHLADETVAMVFDLVGADRIALVTDAMAAAGMPDGRYPLGPMTVDVVRRRRPAGRRPRHDRRHRRRDGATARRRPPDGAGRRRLPARRGHRGHGDARPAARPGLRDRRRRPRAAGRPADHRRRPPAARRAACRPLDRPPAHRSGRVPTRETH